MRVLHVIANLLPEKGGPPRTAIEMCQQLAAAGCSVSLFSGDSGEPSRMPGAIPGVDLRIFETRWRRWGWSPAMAAALNSTAADYDVIHIHSVFLHHTLAAAAAARRAGVPYLIRPHGSFDPWLRRRGRIKKWVYNTLLEQQVLDGAAAIHYTTEAEKDLAHTAMGIRAPAVVIPLGIDTELRSRLPPRNIARALWNIPLHQHVVLFLGRLDAKKGLDLLIAAFARAKRDVPTLHLLIAGPESPQYTGVVDRELRKANIESSTTLTGMVEGEQKLAALAAADVFVLPSYTENFGLAVVEAMGAGVPVVVSNAVNTSDVIIQHNAGWVTTHDTDEISAAILCALRNPLEARARATRAQDLVVGQFTWAMTAARLHAYYETLVA